MVVHTSTPFSNIHTNKYANSMSSNLHNKHPEDRKPYPKSTFAFSRFGCCVSFDHFESIENDVYGIHTMDRVKWKLSKTVIHGLFNHR